MRKNTRFGLMKWDKYWYSNLMISKRVEILWKWIVVCSAKFAWITINLEFIRGKWSWKSDGFDLYHELWMKTCAEYVEAYNKDLENNLQGYIMYMKIECEFTNNKTRESRMNKKLNTFLMLCYGGE